MLQKLNHFFLCSLYQNLRYVVQQRSILQFLGFSVLYSHKNDSRPLLCVLTSLIPLGFSLCSPFRLGQKQKATTFCLMHCTLSFQSGALSLSLWSPSCRRESVSSMCNGAAIHTTVRRGSHLLISPHVQIAFSYTRYLFVLHLGTD